MRFDQSIQIDTSVARVWEFLWDIERVAGCLPGCQNIREVVPQEKYAVVVMEQVGPFKVRFEMDVDVVGHTPEQEVHLHIQGTDNKIRASTRVDLHLAVDEVHGGTTRMNISADVLVMGKIANLGQPMIKRKGQDIMTKFGEAIAAKLGSGSSS